MHNSNADVCEKAVDHEFVNTGKNSAEPYGWTAKTANIGAVIRSSWTVASRELLCLGKVTGGSMKHSVTSC